MLIHAGKGIDKDAMQKVILYNLEFPQSKIIAEVEIENCIKIDDEFNNLINNQNSPIYGYKNRNGYAWKLKVVRKINTNKFFLGKQGIWYINDEI